MFVALLLAAAASSDVCAKLSKEYAENERQMAFEHYINQSFVEIWQKEHNRAEADKTRAELQAADEKHKLDGDRITTLILANKCRAPDHITSWQTYWHEVEKTRERVAAKDAGQNTE